MCVYVHIVYMDREILVCVYFLSVNVELSLCLYMNLCMLERRYDIDTTCLRIWYQYWFTIESATRNMHIFQHFSTHIPRC